MEQSNYNSECACNSNIANALSPFLMPLIDAIADRVAERLILSNKDKEPRYYTREETAERLHITLPTLARITREGFLPVKRLGRKYLYEAKDIDKAVSENKEFKWRRKNPENPMGL